VDGIVKVEPKKDAYHTLLGTYISPGFEDDDFSFSPRWDMCAPLEGIKIGVIWN